MNWGFREIADLIGLFALPAMIVGFPLYALFKRVPVYERFVEGAREGFDVAITGSGEEGLRLASEKKPELITLDVVLPDMDGWKVLEALRSDAALARTPVAVVTVVDERNRGLSLGAADYFVKPIDLDRMAAVLARRRAGAAA